MRTFKPKPCKECGQEFAPSSGSQKYCSLPCALWHRVKRDNPDECWEWTESKDSRGYGQFIFANIRYRSHRVAFELSCGPIPDGLHACHSCDNPGCCRPEHLWLGTHAENMADRDQKGRHRGWKNGSEHHLSKLTEEDVPEIRQRAANGETRANIARTYGVSHQAIGHVIKRRRWKHVP